jgi:hypothetical protein
MMSFTARPQPPATAVPLDASKLDVYAVALEFQLLAVGLLPPRRQAVLRDQLERASVSIVLNIATSVAHQRLRILLVRIVAMLTKLHARMVENAERAGAQRPLP